MVDDMCKKLYLGFAAVWRESRHWAVYFIVVNCLDKELAGAMHNMDGVMRCLNHLPMVVSIERRCVSRRHRLTKRAISDSHVLFLAESRPAQIVMRGPLLELVEKHYSQACTQVSAFPSLLRRVPKMT
jgi:hypothetical protein